jgi:glycosyltransferase involved in cell wall biosynthesis
LAKNRFDGRLARRQADLAVAVSEPLATRARAAGFQRVEAVPVLAPAAREGLQHPVGGCADIVFAGQFSPSKGVDVLVGAFGQVAPRHLAARLVLVGSGTEEQRLRAMVSALPAEVGGRVVFTGRMDADGVAAHMGKARVVVAASLPAMVPEGAGLTVVEAALLGRPVIVSDDPALRDLLDRSGCGLVVAPGSADALAGALDEMLSEPVKATSMGEAGRAVALQRHTVSAVVGRLRALFAELVAGSG